MAGPVKRSVMIAGHATSISLEPIFWDALAAAATTEGVPLNALVARIDAARIAEPDPANLASAIRVWLFRRAREAGKTRGRHANCQHLTMRVTLNSRSPRLAGRSEAKGNHNVRSGRCQARRAELPRRG